MLADGDMLVLADGESGVGAKFYPSGHSKFSKQRIFKPMSFDNSDFQSSHVWRLRLWFTEQNILILKGIGKA